MAVEHHSPEFMKRSISAVIFLAASAALAGCGAPATLLAVNASATTRTAPDLAIVSLGVQATGGSARAAQDAQAAKMTTVLEAAHAAGVEEKDIQTIGLSIDPQYVYPRGGAPRITGYVSRNTISIRVRDLNAVSGLIDATVAEGANELHGIQFTYADDEASRDAARAEALQTARVRAEHYADAADMKVVSIRSIVEPGGAVGGMDGAGARFAPVSVLLEQAAVKNQINPGELDNAASVIVVFELR